MSIEFNRRSFLKAGAAAAALGAMSVVLTGCDSDSSNDGAPAINKKATGSYNVGGVMVEFEGTSSISGTGSTSGMTAAFSFKKGTGSNVPAVISIYRAAFTASYNGKVMNLVQLKDDNNSSVDQIYVTSTTTAVDADVLFNGYDASATNKDLNKFVFKFNYNGKSIKFKYDTDLSTVLTSGVYTDKITL